MAQRGQNRGGRRNGRRICPAAARPWRGAPPGGDRPDLEAGERRPSRACSACSRTASPGPHSRPPGPAAAPMIWPLRTAEQRSWWPAGMGRSSRMPGAPGQGQHQTEMEPGAGATPPLGSAACTRACSSGPGAVERTNTGPRLNGPAQLRPAAAAAPPSEPISTAGWAAHARGRAPAAPSLWWWWISPPLRIRSAPMW